MSILDDGDDDDGGGVVRQALGAARMAGALASAIGGAMGASLEEVSYHAEITGGPSADWHVRRFHLAEAISEPYELSLDLLTADLDVEVEDLLGADVDLELGRASFVRHVQGVIERVEYQGIEADRLGVRLHVAPALKLLVQHVDTRIFQDKKVPQVLQEVLGGALGQYGRKVDVSRLNDTYLVRDYCVQYGESDFHFASRLMEEEGIAYIFEPEIVNDEPTGVELMILVDQNPDAPNSDFPEIEGEIPDQIPIIADRAELTDCESIRYLDWVLPQAVTTVSTRRFNWKRPDPNAPPVATEGGADPRGRTRELYVPDDRRRIADLQGNDCYGGTDVDEDEARLTRRRFQSIAGDRSYGRGASNVTCLRAGGLFTLGDHTHPALAFSQLLVTRAVHHGDCPDREQSSEGGGERYQNSFECIPATTFYRSPETTLKPRVFGPQTAAVTGPEGKEIFTDRHGRIKVKFHWDRISPADETSSCWVRVAQMWGGKGWGTWFLPRIGMEVIVEFLDGNPDRPLVVGCVYNGENEAPYRPDEEPTKSTIKSNSSIGGEGFNELRFEDAKGAEEIFVHAQKDLNEVVLSNRSSSVGGNETITIQGNETVTINGAPVHGAAEAPQPGRRTVITGHEYLETSETVYIKAPKCIVLKVKGSTITMDERTITLQAGGGAKLELSDMVVAHSKNQGSQIQLASEMCPGIAIESESEIVVNGTTIYLNC